MVARSEDYGQTWVNPQVILHNALYFFPSGAAVASNGLICASANVCYISPPYL